MTNIRIRSIVVAMSGGVDSAVSALILKRKGYDVRGVYMQNWSEIDERGQCAGEREFLQAQKAADIIKIPLFKVNFEKQYWNDVFSVMLSDYERGVTPNPDVLCNKHVKFGALFDHVMSNMDADWLATGHYANLHYSRYGVKLLQAKDEDKDQTYFLSQVSQSALRRTMFPLGGLLKKEVRDIARDYRLQEFAEKKESYGICFIGKREFRHFIDEYVTLPPGPIVDIDTGKELSAHEGLHAWTIGQRAHIQGLHKACYVCSMDTATHTLFVARGRDHPALDCHTIYTSTPHWINESYGDTLRRTGYLAASVRVRHRAQLIRASVTQTDTGLCIELVGSLSGLVAPGQWAALYDGEECMGSAQITGKNDYHRDAVS